MDQARVTSGLHIRTTDRLQSSHCVAEHDRRISGRKVSSKGVILCNLNGPLATVWLVEHADGSVAAYFFDELIPLYQRLLKDERHGVAA